MLFTMRLFLSFLNTLMHLLFKYKNQLYGADNQ